MKENGNVSFTLVHRHGYPLQVELVPSQKLGRGSPKGCSNNDMNGLCSEIPRNECQKTFVDKNPGTKDMCCIHCFDGI